ncbi:hypothetical protein D3C78_1634000 [compost metagenome]
MYICFAEYKILEEYREPFTSYTKLLLKDLPHVTLYEGTDQPNLFVEVWQAADAEEAERMKEERCNERSPWFPITDWIAGGAGKLHVWTFKPVH